MSTGTMASNAAAGSTSSSTAPAMPPSSDARGQPQQPGALAGQLARGSRRRRTRARDQADGVGDVGRHRRHAEGQQGRERDQRSRPHHGVDGAGRDPGEQDRDDLERLTRRAAPRRRRRRIDRAGAGGGVGRPRVGGALGRRRWPPRRLGGGASPARCRDARCRRARGSLGPMSTRVRGPVDLLGDALRGRSSWSRGPRAPWPISLGTIQTLLASPSAIFGIIWRYW